MKAVTKFLTLRKRQTRLQSVDTKYDLAVEESGDDDEDIFYFWSDSSHETQFYGGWILTQMSAVNIGRGRGDNEYRELLQLY